MTRASKSLDRDGIKKILDAIEMIEENEKGIKESRHPGKNRPDSGADISDGEAERHI